MLALALLILAAAVPLVIFRRDADRAFWLGFALFGWLYVLLLGYSWGLDPEKSRASPLRLDALATTRLTNVAFERIYGQAESTPSGSVLQALAFIDASSGGRININDPNTDASLSLLIAGGQTVHQEPYHDDFVNVAHAFWAILLAALGGWLTCWIYATRPRQREEGDA
jgi:hypothetical protein